MIHSPAVAQDKILFRLHEMFGVDRAEIVTGDQFQVGRENSRVVAFPQNTAELSEVLKLAHRERWLVIPAGGGTWLKMGNRPSSFHLVVSTGRMDRILEYEPADLTTTLEAGCQLAQFNKVAARNRQFIPLDPFGDENSTLGGTIATASSGPMRSAYGTPRDWLIGIRVVHADGRITKAGGKVVKNVAGYDLCKLYTGSFGTLGVIAEMSFKLRALPPQEKTLVIYADDAASVFPLISKIIELDIQPAACELISPGDTILPLDNGRFALVLRFRNPTVTINWQIDETMSGSGNLPSTVLSDEEASEFWRLYNESEIVGLWGYCLRLSVLPADLSLLIDDLQRIISKKINWRAHAASGVVRIHSESEWLGKSDDERVKMIEELRRSAQSRGGSLVILGAPDEIIDQLDVWGEAGATKSLMRALKMKFDPDGLLNPGRFVAGI
jgi:glycolate oxidase FAD binding subunit